MYICLSFILCVDDKQCQDNRIGYGAVVVVVQVLFVNLLLSLISFILCDNDIIKAAGG